MSTRIRSLVHLMMKKMNMSEADMSKMESCMKMPHAAMMPEWERQEM